MTSKLFNFSAVTAAVFLLVNSLTPNTSYCQYPRETIILVIRARYVDLVLLLGNDLIFSSLYK